MSDDKPNTDVPRELRSLMHRSFDEPIGESDFCRLQLALKSDPRARLLYGQLAQLHADLISQRQASALCREVQLEYRGAPQEMEQGFKAIYARSWLRIFDALQVVPVRIAASLLVVGLGLGCGVGILAATLRYQPLQFVPVPWNWSVGQDVVARIGSTHDVTWQTASENPDTPPTLGLRVGQQLRIERGLLQVSYRNGIEVTLRGPAVYEIRSDRGGKLFSGKLSVMAPSDVSEFNIQTPAGRLQMGTGHFGVDAEVSASDCSVSVFTFAGVASGVSSAQFVSNSGEAQYLIGGDAFKYDASGMLARVSLPSPEEFSDRMPQPHREPFAGEVVYLGNLFDDSKTASLTEAVQTDRYQSAGETTDLGVAAVRDGGLDVDVSVAEDGVLVNFANVGGGGAKVTGLPGNDTYRSIVGIPIRTTGEHFDHLLSNGPLPRIEEGVGISANELLTFDLRELRDAGQLDDRPMRFVADRAGINDRELPLLDSVKNAHANLIVLVSTEDKVISAYLNGEAADVVEHGNVFSLDVDEQRATHGLRYDGQFVTFDVPIPPEARFLTLVTTQNEKEHHDHAVFSGARLEIGPPLTTTNAD